MKKLTTIGGIILALVLIGYGAYSLLRPSPSVPTAGNTAPSADTQGEQVPQEPGAATSTVSVNDAPQGETLIISGPGGSVRINNFYKNILNVVEENQLILRNNPDYEIDYSRADANFYITLRTVNSRSAAEKDLLDMLGIKNADACKLSISEYAAGALGATNKLSFCF